MAYVDLLTVVIAALIFLLISSFWYSSYMFKKQWNKLRNVKNISKRKKTKRLRSPNKLRYLYNFLIGLVVAYILSLLEILSGVVSFWDGVIFGFIAWLGFIGTFQMLRVVFEKRPFKLFLIDNGLYLLNMMIMGGILAG